jgi:threonyl-tRNA synthetase
MNCPFHIGVYRSTLRSYRDLPLRWAELGTVYRFERSGQLHGLLRVRGFTQDDAHLFMRRDQLADEIRRLIRFTHALLGDFGFTDLEVRLSTRPEKSIGSDEIWEHAETALREGLEAEQAAFEIDEGEGTFYGPKIDVKIRDAIGRLWQCSTCQVDFNLPERFDLNYIGEDSARHRPVMLHRTILGSMERFFGVLTEHYAGAFPMWLAPEQVALLTVADRHNEYAREVGQLLGAKGLRVKLDLTNEKLGAKIRQARLWRIPAMAIIGDREVEDRTVSLRTRADGEVGAVALDAFVERMVDESKEPGV